MEGKGRVGGVEGVEIGVDIVSVSLLAGRKRVAGLRE